MTEAEDLATIAAHEWKPALAEGLRVRAERHLAMLREAADAGDSEKALHLARVLANTSRSLYQVTRLIAIEDGCGWAQRAGLESPPDGKG